MDSHTHAATLLGVDLAKAVVAHLVHEAVLQHLGSTSVHTELASLGEVVGLLCTRAVAH